MGPVNRRTAKPNTRPAKATMNRKNKDREGERGGRGKEKGGESVVLTSTVRVALFRVSSLRSARSLTAKHGLVDDGFYTHHHSAQ